MREKSYIVADENIPDVQIDVDVKNTEEENKRICTMIRKIIARGNDAEVLLTVGFVRNQSEIFVR